MLSLKKKTDLAVLYYVKLLESGRNKHKTTNKTQMVGCCSAVAQAVGYEVECIIFVSIKLSGKWKKKDTSFKFLTHQDYIHTRKIT